jgi:hypothetical protein
MFSHRNGYSGRKKAPVKPYKKAMQVVSIQRANIRDSGCGLLTQPRNSDTAAVSAGEAVFGESATPLPTPSTK